MRVGAVMNTAPRKSETHIIILPAAACAGPLDTDKSPPLNYPQTKHFPYQIHTNTHNKNLYTMPKTKKQRTKQFAQSPAGSSAAGDSAASYQPTPLVGTPESMQARMTEALSARG